MGVYLIVGYFLQYFIVNILSSKYQKEVSKDHTLYTPLLTLCFLPLQMFQSGLTFLYLLTYSFSLNGPIFIKNVESISLFSIGVSLLFIFLFSFLFSNFPYFFGLRPMSFWNTLAFASSMAASDSAFILSFLKSIHVSPKILAFLEGETILSEVVAIIMFRTVIELQITVVDGIHLTKGMIYFLSFLVMSFGIGIIIGGVATVLFKSLYYDDKNNQVNILQVTLFFCVPIMAYMLAEGLHVSSSISIRICGFIMASFTQYNLNPKTYPSKCISSFLLCP